MYSDTINEIIKIDYEKVTKNIQKFIKVNLKNIGSNRVVLGLSGGLDSTVVLKLVSRTLPKRNILGLILPVKKITPKDDIMDAEINAKNLDIKYEIIDITSIQDIIKRIRVKNNYLAIGNFNARVRMSILYYYANLENRMVIGTGDKSEILLGYFSKYGDGGVDILPIGGLYKSQVRELAKYLGVSDNIIKKKSSPNLWKDHFAEKEIGFSYEVIDSILYLLVDRRMDPREILMKINNKSAIERVVKMHEKSYHKRMMPIIYKSIY